MVNKHLQLVRRALTGFARAAFQRYPAIIITGPRQAGKTIFARMTFPRLPYANLEAPDVRRFANDDPRAFLAQFPHGAILDEIQRAPELPAYLQPMIDARRRKGLFVLTGSQQFELMRGITQSLAGRAAILRLLPFNLSETRRIVPGIQIDDLIVKGGYPRLHAEDIPQFQALGDYFNTYVQRDLREFIKLRHFAEFERFVRLCAASVGQLLNLERMGNDIGVTRPTVLEWLNLLEAGFIAFRLSPWHANLRKRLVKRQKLYFYDTGLACHLCDIHSCEHLRNHPLRGAMFENWVIGEALKHLYNHGNPGRLYFFRDNAGHEVDLLYPLGPKVIAVEIKAGQTVSADWFNGLHFFRELQPQAVGKAFVVYAGAREEKRSDAHVLPYHRFQSRLGI